MAILNEVFWKMHNDYEKEMMTETSRTATQAEIQGVPANGRVFAGMYGLSKVNVGIYDVLKYANTDKYAKLTIGLYTPSDLTTPRGVYFEPDDNTFFVLTQDELKIYESSQTTRFSNAAVFFWGVLLLWLYCMQGDDDMIRMTRLADGLPIEAKFCQISDYLVKWTTGKVPNKKYPLLLDAQGKLKKITDFEYAMMKGEIQITNGESRFFDNSHQTQINDNNETVDFKKGLYSMSSRKFTEEETSLIPQMEEWYVPSQEALTICDIIQKTTNTATPFHNFMLRGPAGTGKTFTAKAIASGLGLPYVYFTCSVDTEIFDLFGQPIPDKDGKIKFSETPFIKALKNGWVVELQEPTVIAKEGVLVGLNGVLDQGGTVTLPTGEVVKRHPETIVICTTNNSYYGCNEINQSVLSRMNCVYDIDEPSISTIVERVSKQTGFEDKDIIAKVAQIQQKIRDKLIAEDIDDGICGMREIIDCIALFNITHNMYTAMQSTIISKATSDSDIRSDIEVLIKGAFASYDSLSAA